MSQGRRKVQGRRYFPEALRGARERVPGRPPSRRPARLRLDVGPVFLTFILVEEAGAVTAALTLGAALDSATGGVVDLHHRT